MVFSYYTKFTNVDNCSYMSGILFLCRQLFLYVGYLVLMSTIVLICRVSCSYVDNCFYMSGILFLYVGYLVLIGRVSCSYVDI